MAQEFFLEFWIELTDGRKLFLAKILNEVTGRVTFRQLASDSNLTAKNTEYDTPQEAVAAFLNGACMRFGSRKDNDRGFARDGRLFKSYGVTRKFKDQHANLNW